MKKYWLGMMVLLAAGVLSTCAGSGAARGEDSVQDAQISAQAAIGRMDTASEGPLFEGDGGKDIRLAVLAPEGQGLAPEEAYLPVYVQGLLNNNLRKASAMALIDRQNLNQIIAEQDIAANGPYSDDDFISIGTLTNAQYILAGTIQKLPNNQFALQLAITDLKDAERKVEFMKNASAAQLQDGTLINEATEDLLFQMGVPLTAAGKQQLANNRSAAAKAETGLAKGITAEAGGVSVKALLNYTQAAAFDPSQTETLSRLSTLSTTISGGTISQEILSDIEARKPWLEAFKETATFFNEHPPFEITFDPSLIKEGESDYKHETVNLAMRVALDPTKAGWAALNALLSGLETTGQRQTWGFNGWPCLDLTPKDKSAVVFAGKRSFSFKIDIALRNEQGKTIAKNTITLKTETLSFAAADKAITAPKGVGEVVRFPKVNANYLTPVLSVAIIAVNGIPAQTINATGYMRISEGGLEEKVAAAVANFPADFAKVNGGTFKMGSPASEVDRRDNEVQHSVTVRSFYMGRHEVTQKEYAALMGKNPSKFKGDNLPVEKVTWYDAVNYCNALSRKEGLTPAYTVSGTNVTWNQSATGYRLPTEAEWEYACRAGTTTPFNTGNNITTDQANYDGTAPYNGNAKGIFRWTTTAVGSFAANPWGLSDMHGNVWEWCWDRYGDYDSAAQTDPMGASSGTNRVLRGGGWGISGQYLRSAGRNDGTPSKRDIHLGFRLLRPSL